MLQASIDLAVACRDSKRAVIETAVQTLKTIEPCIDAALFFEPEGSELRCVHAGGSRSEYFAALRLPRDGASLPALAAARGHHVAASGTHLALIPSDRSAFAVPLHADGLLRAVLYLSSPRAFDAEARSLAQAAALAAAPYVLASEREMDHSRANFDALTGLFAPRAFRDRLQELVRDRPSGRALALWFIDTDRFKEINDTRGHTSGDAVLRQMADLLRAHTRADADVAARNGGDEFCAILQNTQKVEAIARAARFCDDVGAHDFGVGRAVTASVGVAAYPHDGTAASELLEAADAAMYHSKREARGRVSFAVRGGGFAVYAA